MQTLTLYAFTYSFWSSICVKTVPSPFKLLLQQSQQFNLPDFYYELVVSFNPFEHISRYHMSVRESFQELSILQMNSPPWGRINIFLISQTAIIFLLGQTWLYRHIAVNKALPLHPSVPLTESSLLCWSTNYLGFSLVCCRYPSEPMLPQQPLEFPYKLLPYTLFLCSTTSRGAAGYLWVYAWCLNPLTT